MVVKALRADSADGRVPKAAAKKPFAASPLVAGPPQTAEARGQRGQPLGLFRKHHGQAPRVALPRAKESTPNDHVVFCSASAVRMGSQS
jgi:hypothetical protein